MTKAEQIIVRRIHELDEIIDFALEQLERTDIDTDSARMFDDKYNAYFERKCELMRTLAAIRGCTTRDLVLE